MPRIYVDQTLSAGAEFALPVQAGAHLVRVLRLGVGEHCVLFNGQGGEFDAQIVAVAKARVTVLPQAYRPVERESTLLVTLLPALVRGERMDYIIQKATELGVHAIQPVICMRGNVRINSDAGAHKLDHWRAVAVSACEQCGRNTLPIVQEAHALREGLSVEADLRLLLLPTASDSLPTLLGPMPQRIAVLTGPEGGFDPTEEALAKQADFRACRLGQRVLRTETAPLAALAALQTLAGDFR
ncbi:MAG: 16S rRNA (uracil(1498)-N(3))-methyltransferase [Steroidobacteraceae bacterium]